MYHWISVASFFLVIHAHHVGRSINLHHRAPTAGQIRAELGPQLSPRAVIVDENHGDLAEATLRWQEYSSPTFVSAVEAATVGDVVKTVKYANENSIPFLAKGGGHGSIEGLAALEYGIQITLSRLNGTTVHDNNTATVQGGARTYQVRDALWERKKQTSHGVCECTGFTGPALGGGHGFLQGYYGIALDTFLAARVVLANGTLINVSANENADLWWGLRGAGANFGILTEVDIQIYDVPEGKDSWYYENWDFDAALVEEVFEQHNVFLDNQPAGAVLYSAFLRNPSLDPVNAIIRVGALYNGPKSEADPLFAGFRALRPLDLVGGTVPYNQLPTVTGANLNGPSCQEGGNRVGGGVFLTRYDPQSQREALELFNSTTANIPAFNASVIIFDGFSVEAVIKVPESSTAMPWRGQQILMASVITYEPDSALDQAAEALSFEIRNILQRTSGHSVMKTYINYAFGNETFVELYGSEDRVARLQELKRVYDPRNVFRFFGPLGGLI